MVGGIALVTCRKVVGGTVDSINIGIVGVDEVKGEMWMFGIVWDYDYKRLMKGSFKMFWKIFEPIDRLEEVLPRLVMEDYF